MKHFFYHRTKHCGLFLIKIYQVFMSPHLGGGCRFYPSCSHYAEKALVSYPVLPALYLILKRLSRCHFLGPFGPDPLPPYQSSKKAHPKIPLKKT